MARKSSRGKQHRQLERVQVYQAAAVADVSKMQRLLKQCKSWDRRRLISISLVAAVAFGHEAAGIQFRDMNSHSVSELVIHSFFVSTCRHLDAVALYSEIPA